ncbi:MAG TPA: GRP family sugar transporter [Acidobacteriota bacterium]|nr:GRP family sugar transporter [Acidobacteriota bacterium]
MAIQTEASRVARPVISLHRLGVLCGLAAGAWLGAAEAPTKLVTLGFSPFLISMGMVLGVFVARWTLPMALKGTTYVYRDLREKSHLISWAVLAGALWAVANTLTIFAIRDIGLSVAFPLWNTNSLVGLFWGVLLFRELRGGGAGSWAKVLGGAIAIVIGACILGLATSQAPEGMSDRAAAGIAAALGAGLLWGTMYIPYRKAYISGMNPLSFVTIFTFGELITIGILTITFLGGFSPFVQEFGRFRPALFWLFLGGFCWVIGDLFQQYAAKYVGIARGIPLSNTNQLWGLAWGALVFGELYEKGAVYQSMVVIGSLIIVCGAIAISRAEAPESEQESWHAAMMRECHRYKMDRARVEASLAGEDPLSGETPKRRWWEFLIILVALGIFVWLGLEVQAQDLSMNPVWTIVLVSATVGVLAVATIALWKRTRFS